MRAALNPLSKTIVARLKKAASVAIALSGGGDSMALLLAAKHAGIANITALTVDHGLRPTSAAEARKVKTWCRNLGIAHHTLKWRHGPVTSGLQAKARKARYDLMADWCAKHGVELLLTAHTREDQAETVAMRSARTATAKSLAGIWPEVALGSLTLLRPLLKSSRKNLRAYLTTHGQPWIEDPSNQDEKFERVRLRRQGVAPGLAATASKAQAVSRRAQKQALAWLVKNTQQDASSMISFAPNSFLPLGPAVQDEALILLITRMGGKVPERAKRLAQLAWLAQPTSPRRSMGGVIFASRKNQMCIGREAARITPHERALRPRKPSLWDGRFLATGPAGSTITSKSKIKSLTRIKDLPAFVDEGLPVILLNGQPIATPYFSRHPSAKLTLATK